MPNLEAKDTPSDMNDITFIVPSDRQCIIIMNGNGQAFVFYDTTHHLDDVIRRAAPIERAVVIARLRTLADLFEKQEQD